MAKATKPNHRPFHKLMMSEAYKQPAPGAAIGERAHKEARPGYPNWRTQAAPAVAQTRPVAAQSGPPSSRCEDDCQPNSCALPESDRGRWWPDCPLSRCPEWKAVALGIVGLSDSEQRALARVPRGELTADELAVLAKLSCEAGLIARDENYRRKGLL